MSKRKGGNGKQKTEGEKLEAREALEELLADRDGLRDALRKAQGELAVLREQHANVVAQHARLQSAAALGGEASLVLPFGELKAGEAIPVGYAWQGRRADVSLKGTRKRRLYAIARGLMAAKAVVELDGRQVLPSTPGLALLWVLDNITLRGK